eukprot:CAMPEP_0202783820 /NCGR_PEP_ID=MMETSP1388-20130828/65224_1 /ASSEMBLY_ACC=CAM_ASM_000864 /TAXON_ID=37098 /ORGANISM="Isochrysis sp, Strain CCMP1244" /LENGTH=84 /DNA_ID=CAMNT_0049453293 /DNA_START=457 /DNA_END=707 /DNA_ORIENTATION=-
MPRRTSNSEKGLQVTPASSADQVLRMEVATEAMEEWYDLNSDSDEGEWRLPDTKESLDAAAPAAHPEGGAASATIPDSHAELAS